MADRRRFHPALRSPRAISLTIPNRNGIVDVRRKYAKRQARNFHAEGCGHGMVLEGAAKLRRLHGTGQTQGTGCSRACTRWPFSCRRSRSRSGGFTIPAVRAGGISSSSSRSSARSSCSSSSASTASRATTGMVRIRNTSKSRRIGSDSRAAFGPEGIGKKAEQPRRRLRFFFCAERQAWLGAGIRRARPARPCASAPRPAPLQRVNRAPPCTAARRSSSAPS